jgi:cell division protease FtsH
MTDVVTPPDPTERPAVESPNGYSKEHAKRVRSGLAERRNPVLVAVGDFGSTVLRVALRDLLSLFLVVASVVLAITFAVLLGQIKPSSSGREVPLSTVQELAKKKALATAVLLDRDSRVVLTTSSTAPAISAAGTLATSGSPEAATGGGAQRLWAAYPASGAQTQQLAKELDGAGAVVSVDQQSGKPTKAIVVQFLIPILLLVCLFSLFMRAGTEGAAGGLASFSESGAKGRKKGKGTRDKITFADVAGAGDALAELREIRDYLADPSKYLEVGAAAPKGVLLVGPPGTGKTL